MPNLLARTAAAALAAGLAACATASTPGTEPAPSAQTSRTVIVTTDQTNVPEVSTSIPVASRTTTTLSPDTAFALVEGAYAALGIPVTLRLPDAHQIGNQRFTARGHLNGHLLSTYVNCGQTLVINHADQDQIIMSIVTTVRRTGSGSAVETLVTANAVDRTSGNAGAMMNCTSTGALETALHRAAFGHT
jgi:hypothetical protein